MSDLYSNNAMFDVFVFEMSQLINQLEEHILENEKKNCFSDAAINEIFRIMHTLKGSSAMMEFGNIAALAHCMEDLFSSIRNEKNIFIEHSKLTDILLECVDFLKNEETKIMAGNSSDGNSDSLIKEIQGYIPTRLNKSQWKEIVPSSFISAEQFKSMNLSDSCMYYKAHIFFDEEISMENVHAYSIVNNFKKAGHEIYYIPSDIVENEDSAEVIRRDGFYIFIKSENSYEELKELLRHAVFVKELEFIQLQGKDEFETVIDSLVGIRQIDADTKSESGDCSKTEVVKENKSTNVQQNIISVNVTKLDKLMDLVGEMVIAEAMVTQNSDLAGLSLNSFQKAARQLSKITTEIQDIVMSIRMVPLAATFHRMNRIVRDMNKKLGKEVKLDILGEETEVDKNIIEHISDPLMHLVRNSIDHGIEMPEVRREKEKSRIGKITLEAKNAGSEVLIIIKDDGKGLDREKILQKAREKQLFVKPVADITDKELFGMIFLPGFSTNDEVTEFSGRGVGMDVVTQNLELIGGSISVDSTPDCGTTITLKIPLTLAIIDGINIKVGKSHYTIPTVNIVEFFRLEDKNIIIDPHGNEMIMVREHCYAVLKLYELFDICEAATVYSGGIIIMVEVDGNMFCIFADELLGQQQVVVKALPEYIRRTKKIKGLSGCTLLGNGSISLILDIAALSISI